MGHKVNIGCGTTPTEGYINLDMFERSSESLYVEAK
jgi:hypothetical protein